jgi:hypothetical protein
MAGGGIHNDFWVEQTLCAGCGQTDPNGGLPLVAMPGGVTKPYCAAPAW